MSCDFQTKTHAKAILTGEHAVLRGHPVIVMPILSKTLSLTYWADSDANKAEFIGDYGEDMHVLFWSLLEHGFELIGKSVSEFRGKFLIENTIPVGAGMGASGALCSAVSHWFISQGWIEDTNRYVFARQLEDLFHGQSSGIDVIGATVSDWVWFNQIDDFETLTLKWQPQCYLSFSEQVGVTSHCVKKVKQLWQDDPESAKHIDQQMADSVQLAKTAIENDQMSGLTQLANAMNQAKTCFNQWGLSGRNIHEHIDSLLEAGALAAKPTGSGDGGYVLSLWSSTPPENLLQHFIPTAV